MYCKGENRSLDLTIFFKNLDFLPKIHNVPSLGLTERCMNHRILINNAELISYIFSEI